MIPSTMTDEHKGRQIENMGPPETRGAKKGQIAKNSSRDLAKAFTSRLAADFRKNGIGTIEKVRQANPTEYLKIIARLLPKDVTLTVEHTFSDVLLDAQRKINERKAAEVIIGEAEVIRDDL